MFFFIAYVIKNRQHVYFGVKVARAKFQVPGIATHQRESSAAFTRDGGDRRPGE